jgi:hypothetical protein
VPLLRRLLASAAVVGTASALCVCAALASAGPLGKAANRHPRLTLTHRALARVAALAPGDRAQRTLELRYRGSGRFTAVYLRALGLSRSLLGTSRNGLRLTVERCSRPWTKSRRTRVFGCRGRHWVALKTVRLTSRKPLKLRHLSGLPGRTDHLRLTVSLPRQAGNALQLRTARIAYRFVGVAAR